MKVVRKKLKSARNKTLELVAPAKEESKTPILDSLQQAKEPTVLYFTDEAMVKMMTLVMSCSLEVGWQGIVEKKEKGVYLIKDVFTYPQATSAANIWIDDLRFGIWQANLCMEDPDRFDSIRLHGHSHVNMSTFASGEDRLLQYYWTEALQENQFYIFLIINKRLEYWCKIVDREDGLLYEKALIDTETCAVGSILKDYSENVNTIVKREEMWHGRKQVL